MGTCRGYVNSLYAAAAAEAFVSHRLLSKRHCHQNPPNQPNQLKARPKANYQTKSKTHFSMAVISHKIKPMKKCYMACGCIWAPMGPDKGGPRGYCTQLLTPSAKCALAEYFTSPPKSLSPGPGPRPLGAPKKAFKALALKVLGLLRARLKR